MEQGEIILYQPDEAVKLEVRLEDETVWLTQAQMAELFDIKENTITYHIKEIYNTEELDVDSTTRKIRVVRKEGNRNVNRNIDFYNLDMIISVGYRVSSKRGTQFRQWANRVLKDYLLKGYSINQRVDQLENKIDQRLIAHDRKLEELTSKVDFFVQTSLPPVEGIFFDGQIFDAYTFATNLIKSATRSIVLIDNYIDEDVLLMLSKRSAGVTATIYTKQITPQLQLDLNRHNHQYPRIIIRTYRQAHDRFVIIDNNDVYHIGASLKDLGKKLFAFSKMDIPATTILNLL
ncbi:virulence RhuM family protein [Bacteroides ovatus]|nr:RhuM family protein [Bacteroides ovatus]MCS2434808.1 virulence RhuM family protein [Bacteroides ovatus]MDC2735030.1 RhuM family protein [Bacteroides ovatus]